MTDIRQVVQQLIAAGLGMFGFGQSDEGELRVTEVTPNGTKTKKLRFTFQFRDGGKWYPIAGLTNFWTSLCSEFDMRLGDLVRKFQLFGVTFWGADLVLLDENCQPLAAANYPSALRDSKLAETIRGIDKRWWHFALKGAAQDAYQPLGVLGFMFQHLPRDVWEKVRYIVPVSDWLRFSLTGEKGHDVNMLQSMGLYGDAKVAVAVKFQELFGEPLPGALCPWPDLGNDYISTGKTCVAPFSHDSIWTRLLGPTIWSGSWSGVSVLNEAHIIPCEATLAMGMSFEGAGKHQAIQANVGMHGAVYEALVKLMGMTFANAAEFARTQSGLLLVKPDDLNGRTPQEAAGFVQGMLNGRGHAGTREEALVAVLRSLAASCNEYLTKLGTAVGRPLNSISLVGGFAENPAFAEYLRQLGLEVVIPPNARDMTEMGYLADMVRRYVLATTGEDVPLLDILPHIPAMVR